MTAAGSPALWLPAWKVSWPAWRPPSVPVPSSPRRFCAATAAHCRRLNRLRRFRAVLDRLFRIRPGLALLAESDTIVCRCEEVTRAEVEAGIAAGGITLPTLKVMTRVGMGPCQGQMCWPALARLLASATGGSPEAAGPLRVRPAHYPRVFGGTRRNGKLLGGRGSWEGEAPASTTRQEPPCRMSRGVP